MVTLDNIKKTLAEHRHELSSEFNVKDIGVFGSYARGEQDKKSDLDVLVTFRKPIGLFRFIALEYHLEKLIGVKVDLVSKSALKPRIGKRILSEVVYVR